VVNGTPPPWWRSLFSDACGDGDEIDGENIRWNLSFIGGTADAWLLDFFDEYVIVMWGYVYIQGIDIYIACFSIGSQPDQPAISLNMSNV